MSDVQLSPQTAGLDITFADGATRHFSWRWLRDHDQSPAAFNAKTAQRQLDTFAIDPGLISTDVALDDRKLVIQWAHDVDRSTVSLDLLESVSGHAAEPDDRRPWNANSFGAAVEEADRFEGLRFEFHDLTSESAGDRATSDWLQAIHVHGFSLVSGIPPEVSATEQLVRRIAPPLDTIFGTMWTVESGSTDHADSAYSSEGLEPHTDGTYVHDAPGLQLLHFVHQAGDGGASVLVDGLSVVEQLLRDEPEAVDVLRSAIVPAHYIEPGVELRAARPALRFRQNSPGRPLDLEQLSFNNYDRSPMWLETDSMDQFYAAYGALHDRIIDPANQLEVSIQPGEAVVFDNWRVLHGRTGFTGRRVFNGAYIARDRFDSRRRVLADAGSNR